MGECCLDQTDEQKYWGEGGVNVVLIKGWVNVVLIKRIEQKILSIDFLVLSI